MLQRGLGALVALLSVVFLSLIVLFQVALMNVELPIIFSGYLLVLSLPSLVIDLTFTELGKGLEESIATRCGGLQYGGYLIGYVERSLIFLAIMIAYFDSALSYAAILSFLSVIIAGKAIFRYSSRESSDRACADWYILGTLMSITMALALSWWVFRFLLAG